MRSTMVAMILVACSGHVLLRAEDRPVELPFKLYRGYAIVVRGAMGRLEHLNFLLDTGAVPSVVDQRIAKKLRLVGSLETVSVFTQALSADRVSIPAASVGPLRIVGVSAVVRDLSFAEEALGTRIDAIIGLDFLNQSPFTIDYRSRKITIGPIDPSMVAVSCLAGQGYAVVEMTFQQRILRLLVDTGASDLVLFASAVHGDQDVKNLGTRNWSNMSGEIRVQAVQLKDAYLGTAPWGARTAYILADDGSLPAGLSGLLGVASLGSRRVGLDPGRKLLAWDIAVETAHVASRR